MFIRNTLLTKCAIWILFSINLNNYFIKIIPNSLIFPFADWIKIYIKRKIFNKLATYKSIENDIDSCDMEIDDMVFDLYGLNEEEREVILGSN